MWKQEGVREEIMGVTVISIRLCVLSTMWKQEGVREEIMEWECNCY